MKESWKSDQVLLFKAGGLVLGVFLAEIDQLLVEEELLVVPFSHRALAGLLVLRGAQLDAVPVFDLLGLVEPTEPAHGDVRPRGFARGATVALFPTEQGPVGLRLEALLGTVAQHQPLDASLPDVPAALLPTLTHAARAEVRDGATDSVEQVVFSFFSPEGFLASVMR